jgi:hypothetical protein
MNEVTMTLPLPKIKLKPGGLYIYTPENEIYIVGKIIVDTGNNYALISLKDGSSFDASSSSIIGIFGGHELDFKLVAEGMEVTLK